MPRWPFLINPRAATTQSLRRAKVAALLEGVYSLVPFGVAYFYELRSHGSPPTILYAAIGLTLSVLLVLRTNSAYERWWEARKLWGALVNVSRNLVVKARTIARPEPAELKRFAELVIGFAPLLRDHLRGGGPALAAATADRPAHHAPSQRMIEIYEVLAGWQARGLIDGERLLTLDREARDFLDICGACERILKTPLTASYQVFLRQGTWLYLLILPWGIIGDIDWWVIPLTIVQAYLFVAIAEIARAIENPFGFEDDDLDLDAICLAIEQSVRGIAG